MNQFKFVFSLFVLGLFLTAGIVRAEDKAAAAPGSSKSTMKEANALAEEGKTEEAVALYQKMGELKSPKAEAWRLNNYGRAYLIATTPDPEKAVPLLEKAVEADDTNHVAWNNLGVAYEQTDDLEKAKEAYQKSVDAAKAVEADTAKAQANLDALQVRLDNIQAKKDKAEAKAAKAGDKK